MCSAKDRYTLLEQSSNYRITCMQYSQKNFMRIIGNDQKNNGQYFWEILERIIGKISSIIGAGLERTSAPPIPFFSLPFSVPPQHSLTIAQSHKAIGIIVRRRVLSFTNILPSQSKQLNRSWIKNLPS